MIDARTVLDAVAGVLVLVGSLYLLAATIGVLRLRDTMSRMQPATKPQVAGLSFIVIGAALRLRDAAPIGMLALVVLLALVAAPVIANRIASAAYRESPANRRSLVVDELAEDTAAEMEGTETGGTA